jgi:uncharacterized phage-associated protein
MMKDILEVAAYIAKHNDNFSIFEKNQMSATKLQKLCYYAQAWHYVWAAEPLIEEDFQAWVFGPVEPKLFSFINEYGMAALENISITLTEDQQESIELVLKNYGPMDKYELVELSHSEAPWLEARKGLLPHDRSDNKIDKEAIYNYFEGQLNGQKAKAS